MIILMPIFLWKKILLIKTFTVDDFDATNNTAANATAANAENINVLGEKKLVFNGVQIENAEDLDVVMPMYDLLEYSKNYKKTTGSLWNYYRDEPNSGINGGINYSIVGSQSLLKMV